MTTVKLSDYPDSLYSRTICQCTDNRCDVDTSIDIDGDGYVEVGFQVNLVSQPNSNWNDWFWHDWWWRIKMAAKAIFKGRIDSNHYILMNQKGLKEFREALEEGIAQVEEYHKKKEKK